MYSTRVTVENESGLHARPASLFTEAAMNFESEVYVLKGEEAADAKSMLFLISLGVFKGTEITISAEGPDEVEAVETLARLVASKFGETE